MDDKPDDMRVVDSEPAVIDFFPCDDGVRWGETFINPRTSSKIILTEGFSSEPTPVEELEEWIQFRVFSGTKELPSTARYDSAERALLMSRDELQSEWQSVES